VDILAFSQVASQLFAYIVTSLETLDEYHPCVPSRPVVMLSHPVRKPPDKGFAFPRAHKRRLGCMYRLTSPYNQALVFAAGDYFERASRILNPADCLSRLFQFRRVLKSLLEIVVSWWVGRPDSLPRTPVPHLLLRVAISGLSRCSAYC
jgi:hypothetical protein